MDAPLVAFIASFAAILAFATWSRVEERRRKARQRERMRRLGSDGTETPAEYVAMIIADELEQAERAAADVQPEDRRNP